ncbi:MAG: hypothetical protein M3Y91_14540 [Actinomycetota bacterium]|nr:hypothetical protein [Actinomycetota bacterium]
MASGADRTQRDVGGAVGGAVVLFLAFALVAVILLSSTVISAVAINNKVKKTITPAVQGINTNLNSVPLLDKTNSMAGQILTAAKPLSNEAGQIVSATSTINDSVSKIHDSATAINGNVKSIDGQVSSINGNLSKIDPAVSSINSTVNQINTNVGQINTSVGSVGSAVNAISASVGPINSSVNSINGNFANILPVTVGIRGVSGAKAATSQGGGSGIAGINNRADGVINAAGAIKGDTTTIRSAVGAIQGGAGTINTAVGSINNNAARIDNAPLLAITDVTKLPAVVVQLLCSILPLPGVCPGAAPVAPHLAAPAPRVAAAPHVAAAPPIPALPSLTNAAPVLNGIAPLLNGLGGLLPGFLPNTNGMAQAPSFAGSTAPQTPNMLTNLLQGLGFGL